MDTVYPGPDWSSWKPVERAVLCFIRDGEKLLLIEKKTGLGAGKVNGPGGRIEPGESALDAAVRETVEETGLRPRGLVERARLSFQFVSGYSLHCRAFFASAYSGTMGETVEAKPFWCRASEVPFHRMWEDDKEWFPHALANRCVEGYFVFDGDTMKMKIVRFPEKEFDGWEILE